jgi:hypothetical protein
MEKESIGQRIKLLIYTLKYNNRSFGKKIGFTDAAIGKIVRDMNGPSRELLNSIYKNFPEINPIWLEHGKGEMFSTQGPLDPTSSGIQSTNNHYLFDYLSKLENKWESISTEKDHIIQEKDRTIEEKVSTINNLLYMIDLLKVQIGDGMGKLCVNEKESAVLQMDPTIPVTMKIAA